MNWKKGREVDEKKLLVMGGAPLPHNHSITAILFNHCLHCSLFALLCLMKRRRVLNEVNWLKREKIIGDWWIKLAEGGGERVEWRESERKTYNPLHATIKDEWSAALQQPFNPSPPQKQRNSWRIEWMELKEREMKRRVNEWNSWTIISVIGFVEKWSESTKTAAQQQHINSFNFLFQMGKLIELLFVAERAAPREQSNQIN